MKAKFFFFAAALACAAPAAAQQAVYDMGRNALLIAGGQETVSENRAQSSLNEMIQQMMAKVQELTEEVQDVINTASSYVQASEDIYVAAKVVKQTAEMYGNFCEDIKQCELMTPTEQVRAINKMAAEVNNISQRMLSMQQLAGLSSASGLSYSQRHVHEGRMNDGERLKILRSWLGSMTASMYSLQAIYRAFMHKNAHRSYDNFLNEQFASALFFNY